MVDIIGEVQNLISKKVNTTSPYDSEDSWNKAVIGNFITPGIIQDVVVDSIRSYEIINQRQVAIDKAKKKAAQLARSLAAKTKLTAVASVDAITDKNKANQYFAIKHKAFEPRTITIQTLIATDEDFAEVEKFKKDCYASNPFLSEIKPFKIIHPRVNSYNIVSAYFVSVSEGYPDPVNGFLCDIVLVENLQTKAFTESKVPVEATAKPKKKKADKFSKTPDQAVKTARDVATGA